MYLLVDQILPIQAPLPAITVQSLLVGQKGIPCSQKHEFAGCDGSGGALHVRRCLDEVAGILQRIYARRPKMHGLARLPDVLFQSSNLRVDPMDDLLTD